MCGIIGYIGYRDADTVIMSGLWKMEYRGYDSAGVAGIVNNEIEVRRAVGKLSVLAEILDKEPIGGNIGIGHTRWATHGEPSIVNAHPQIDCYNTIAVVHNGIIENYLSLREELINRHHIFRSFTDTEVIPHLIEENYDNSLEDAVRKTIKKLEGAFSFAVISSREPNKIVCVKKSTPLIIGIGKDECILASDILAIVSIVRDVIILDDYEMAVVTRNGVTIYDSENKIIEKKPMKVDGDVLRVELEGYPHFMLKEIYEQPQVIEQNIKRMLSNKEFSPFELHSLKVSDLAKVSRIIIQACGTSWHAGFVGKYLIEKFARIHTEVDISSEFRYRNPVISGETLVIAISQSGETADTIAGVREAKLSLFKVLSIVNVMNSTIARESDDVIYIHAGPEIGVASTKAYVAQLFVLFLFALYLSKLKWIIKDEEINFYINELKQLPEKMKKILNQAEHIRKIAKKYYQARNFLFLGRGINYPSALEGALKLKEISYIHATGYAAGEMKHGPIALIDEHLPVVCICPKSSVYEKMLSNIEEVKARHGKIITIATEGDERVKKLSNDVIYIPEIDEYLSPMLVALPLQLLAYHIAVLRGLDVDKPRNLAKSVTVE